MLVFAISGCSKTESEQTASEQHISTTEQMTEKTTEEVSGDSKIETETVLDDDGSISITSKDSAGNVVVQINYDASTNITEKYIYEYDEQGNLLRELNYAADGNFVAEFEANNYENATSSGEINYDISDAYNIDIDNAFTATIKELEPLYNKAEEIWDKYGVLVLIADKVSDYTDGAEVCIEYEVIQNSLNLIESCLGCYPENFFENFSGDVCIQLVGTGSSSGAYIGGYEYRLIQIDANCYNSSDGGNFFCYTLHHEMFHMIDEMLMDKADDSECPLSEEKWNSYNPQGFEYVNGYDDEKETEIYDSGTNFEYFISSYGCSTPGEDRAMIFGTAMAYYQGYEYMEFNDYVNAKLKYLSECIRAGFQSDDWEDIAPWDYMLNR